MESVNLQSTNYNNVYSSQNAAENTNVSFKGESKDSFDKKYKKNKNNETMNAIATVALMALCVFAGYKNKDKISNIAGQLKEKSLSGLNSLKTKFPNLSNAMSSLRKACDKPINVVKGFGNTAASAAGSIFDAAKNKIGNFHIKKV